MDEGKEIHAIMNIEKYASYIRKKAALSFSEDYNENLDEFVTINQVCNLIIKYSIGKDEENRYLIEENSYYELFDAIKTWIYNCGLSKLASKGVLECAWDAEKNEMIFWKNN